MIDNTMAKQKRYKQRSSNGDGQFNTLIGQFSADKVNNLAADRRAI